MNDSIFGVHLTCKVEVKTDEKVNFNDLVFLSFLRDNALHFMSYLKRILIFKKCLHVSMTLRLLQIEKKMRLKQEK